MELELVWDVLDLAGGTRNTPGKLYRNFHQDPTSGSLSRFHLFFKSLPGVLKDIDVHDEAGDGVMFLKKSQGNLTESFIKIQH